MKEDLEKRVEQFNLLELPGQPRIMHMGTAYLISDLYQEILRLEDQLKEAQAEKNAPM